MRKYRIIEREVYDKLWYYPQYKTLFGGWVYFKHELSHGLGMIPHMEATIRFATLEQAKCFLKPIFESPKVVWEGQG
jgi:hypothetical protein